MAFVYWIHLPEHTDITSEGYVGFTSRTVENRLKHHKTDSNRDKCKNLPIYNAMRKYGDLLIVDTLVEGSTEYCLMIENKLRPKPKTGWNINIGGGRGSLGVKRSEETNRKHSASVSGSKHHAYGKKVAKEVIDRIVLSRKLNAKPVTQETRDKMSAANKGLVRSAESREKISKGLKGVKKSQEHCEAMSRAMKLRELSPWEHPKAKVCVWLLAEQVRSLMTQGVSISEIERKFDTGFRSMATLSTIIKNGWNPIEDTKWVAFKGSHVENKEQHES